MMKPPKLDIGSATMPRIMAATPASRRISGLYHAMIAQVARRAPISSVDTPEIVETWMMMFETSNERYAGVIMTMPESNMNSPAANGRRLRQPPKPVARLLLALGIVRILQSDLAARRSELIGGDG